MIIHGSLYLSYEYTDGVLWCLDDGNRVFLLKTGDHLKIYDKEENPVFDSKIKFVYVDTCIKSFYVKNMPENVDNELWIDLFFNQNKAILIRKDC